MVTAEAKGTAAVDVGKEAVEEVKVVAPVVMAGEKVAHRETNSALETNVIPPKRSPQAAVVAGQLWSVHPRAAQTILRLQSRGSLTCSPSMAEGEDVSWAQARVGDPPDRSSRSLSRVVLLPDWPHASSVGPL